MTPVTRNCEYCNAEFQPVRDHQRFCATVHRVYANRYGASYGQARGTNTPDTGPADQSIAAALAAAQAFTPVTVGETKTVGAIRIERPEPDPNQWVTHVPANSAIAAGKIHGDLIAHIGDLISLANKIGGEIGEPLHSLRTKPRPRR